MLVIIYKEDELKNSILMIFANKQDMKNPLTPAEISKSLGLCSLKNRTWSIFKTSALNGEGLEEAMNWLGHLCDVFMYKSLLLVIFLIYVTQHIYPYYFRSP